MEGCVDCTGQTPRAAAAASDVDACRTAYPAPRHRM